MKLSTLFLALTLVSALNAGQTTLEKYTELRNNSNIDKVKSDRKMMLQDRNDIQEVRDYRDAMRDLRAQRLYARLHNSYTPYR